MTFFGTRNAFLFLPVHVHFGALTVLLVFLTLGSHCSFH